MGRAKLGEDKEDHGLPRDFGKPSYIMEDFIFLFTQDPPRDFIFIGPKGKFSGFATQNGLKLIFLAIQKCTPKFLSTCKPLKFGRPFNCGSAKIIRLPPFFPLRSNLHQDLSIVSYIFSLFFLFLRVSVVLIFKRCTSKTCTRARRPVQLEDPENKSEREKEIAHSKQLKRKAQTIKFNRVPTK